MAWARAFRSSLGPRVLDEIGALVADAGLGFLEDPIRRSLAVLDNGGLSVASRSGIAGEVGGAWRAAAEAACARVPFKPPP